MEKAVAALLKKAVLEDKALSFSCDRGKSGTKK